MVEIPRKSAAALQHSLEQWSEQPTFRIWRCSHGSGFAKRLRPTQRGARQK